MEIQAGDEFFLVKDGTVTRVTVTSVSIRIFVRPTVRGEGGSFLIEQEDMQDLYDSEAEAQEALAANQAITEEVG